MTATSAATLSGIMVSSVTSFGAGILALRGTAPSSLRQAGCFGLGHPP
ncbi:hypothetical protein [Methylobacterium sp. C1]|nr:hypothetical protein [Methylobacterium sp. C1]